MLPDPLVTSPHIASTDDATGAYTPSDGSAARPMDLPDVPGYVVLAEVARGGQGRVLAATDTAFGREVAVKVLLRPDPEAGRRFVREAGITGRLAHPGIPPAYHVGELADGSPFLAMKLVRGRTLADHLATRPSLAHELPRFVGVVEQIAQAVGFAHSQGVVHRDLKPANVMVGAFGEVQVMDWGLALEKDEGGQMTGESGPRSDSSFILPPSSFTQAGTVLGTPAYMAPEQARGEPAGARADVFALGGLLGEVLTGRRTFTGASTAEVIGKAAAGDVSETFARLDACGADSELVALAKRCLSADPAARPPDGTAVAAGLAAHRAGVEERLRLAEREHAAAAAREAEGRKRRRVQAALAVAVLVLVAGAGGVAVWRVDEDGRKRIEAVRLEGEERERRERNASALGALLDEAAKALRANDPDGAAVALEAAGKRAAEPGADALADRLVMLTSDLNVLRRLEEIDENRFVEGRELGMYQSGQQTVIMFRQVGADSVPALRSVGADPEVVTPERAASRITESAIRDRMLFVLDSYLPNRSPRVRAALAMADPEPFREEYRAAVMAGDFARRLELVRDKRAIDQPPWFIRSIVTSISTPLAAQRQLLEAAVQMRPDDFPLLMTLGATYDHDRRQADPRPAHWYQAAVSLRPKSSYARHRLGYALELAGDTDGAIAAHRAAIRLLPNEPRYHMHLGIQLRKKGDLPGAVAALEVAVRNAPQNPDYQYFLGDTLWDTGDLARAIAAYREAVRNCGSTTLDPHDRLASALRVKGDFEGAKEVYVASLSRTPRRPETLTKLAAVLWDMGDLDGAVTTCREALQTDPKAAAPHYYLASLLRLKGEGGAADAAHRDGLRTDPQYVSKMFDSGVAWFRMGNVDRAIAAYRETTRLDPVHVNAHFNLGCDLPRKHDWEGGAAALQRTVQLAPRHAQAHANLGNAYRVLGRPADAVASYRAALAVEPNLGHARAGLAYCERVLRGEVPTAPPPRPR